MDHTKRKIEHIEISLRGDIVFENNCKDIFNEVILVHQAFPRLSLKEVDITTRFLGYELDAPVLIEAITGGHPQVKIINEALGKTAGRYRVAIGLGSQRPIITSNFNREIIETYRVVREYAREVPVIGNIGITQLRELDIEIIKELVNVIEADALAIHLNPAQEIIQPEGDHDFRSDLLDKVERLVKELGKPVIIKEVGNGLSMEVVRLFSERGVRLFDTAGSCGTSWVKIEALRNPDNTLPRKLGSLLHELKWGIPTPISLIETRYSNPSAFIIASGGVWNGVYAAKLIALGGDIVGFARPMLKVFLENGVEGMNRYIEEYITELKFTMFLVGARSIKELRSSPIVLGPWIKNYVEQRGIKIGDYISRIRIGVY
ncbi:MAG: type 2 isopentenyl-diphosphate Delta-isomerase [Desulfurococcaceae archaeon]